jgi:hypothetical protein
MDPCQGSYNRILTRFDVDANPGVTHSLLYEQAVGASTTSQAYLCCATIQQEVKVFCVHLLSKFVGALDGTTTQLDRQGFAALGEVTNTTVTTVCLPNNVFRAVMNTRAKSSDYIVTHLDELGRKGLPPAAANDADASIVNTRMLMYLPAH